MDPIFTCPFCGREVYYPEFQSVGVEGSIYSTRLGRRLETDITRFCTLRCFTEWLMTWYKAECREDAGYGVARD